MAKEYKEEFTLDGKLRVPVGVTEAKVQAIRDLVDETMSGSRSAKGTLEEAMVSSDAVFNLAYLTELNVLADFDNFENRNWSSIATTRPVSDFRNVTLYSLRPDWSANGTLGSGDPVFVAPRIPEGANYPYAYLEQESSQQVGGIVKRGFKTGFTFESFINDAVGFLQALPESMRGIAEDTDEWEVFNALITGVTSAEELDGGPVPYGEDTATVLPNAPISRNALVRAMIELGERKINNRNIVVSGGWTLLIPAGQRMWVEYILNNVVGPTGYEDGSFQFTINGYNPLAGIEIIESEFVSGTQWFLIPKANQARRPILELLRLVGHEVPELRVNGNTGSFVGGGAVDPFEGNFDNDSADFRLRMFTKGILWTKELVVYSDGTGVA
jgi:hypothetical protein